MCSWCARSLQAAFERDQARAQPSLAVIFVADKALRAYELGEPDRVFVAHAVEKRFAQ